jgi:diguanylate cyclase (GGDEF)-like protein
VTGLPHIEQLDGVLQSLFDSDQDGDSAHSIILIDIADLRNINDEHGRAGGDSVLRSVVQHVRAQIRVADILFRNTGDGFIAFLAGTDRPTAEVVARNVRDTLLRSPLAISPSITVTPHVTISVATSPSDGILLADLLASARGTSRASASTASIPK